MDSFSLTLPLGSPSSVTGKTNVYGENGLIMNYGTYTQAKNLDPSGLVSFYPTTDGTPAGTELFLDILNVDASAVSETLTQDRFPVATVVSINTSEIVIRVIENRPSTMLIGSIFNPLRLSTDSTIRVHVKINGRLKSEYVID